MLINTGPFGGAIASLNARWSTSEQLLDGFYALVCPFGVLPHRQID